MALVKKSKLASKLPHAPAPPPRKAAPAPSPKRKGDTATRSNHQQTATERIAAATEELASGLAQSAAATKELGRSMEQIAAGAEEAAGASQEQSVAIRKIVVALTTARNDADSSNRRTETVTLSLSETSAQIANSIRAIERGAQRQSESVTLITELDRRARDIGEITRAVSRISDQTNLLALNAAIEAARAGENGRGFAVVADEVRTLAETSDRNAREVQSLTESIQVDVVAVGEALRAAAATALSDARSAARVSSGLDARREDMARIADGSREILSAALEAERAAAEAQKGAEQIASAADEQSSGSAEAQTAVEQQAKALDQGQVAAQGLAELAEQLRSGKGGTSAVVQIGATSEELSASIQELSTAAAQVMAAIEQINRASQVQSAATQQTSAALNQIESSARLAQNASRQASDRVSGLTTALKDGRAAIESLITGVSTGLEGTRASVATIKRLETVGRKIEKIVEAIALIAVQTSMLAVSGAVEAARAGESGRGFAVVSNDIRSLSREASENVERAKDTVRGILDQISLLRSDLDQIITASEVEVLNSRGVFASLQKIEKDVDAVGLAGRSIQEGAESILIASTEIAAAARQVATAAEEAGAASREAASASTELARGVEDLAAGIEEIATLADESGSQRPDDAMDSASPTSSNRFLTFRLSAQLYALRSEDVAEVIRVPPLARVPQGPPALRGIANLRGSILPVAGLRELLGLPPMDDPSTARAIVLDHGAPVALIVDSVANLESANPEQVEVRQKELGADGAEKLLGAFSTGTQQVAKILDIKALLESAFSRRARVQQQTRQVAPGRHAREKTNQVETEVLVTFDVAGQEFALPLDVVHEILPAPAAITAVARADAAVLGITSVRGLLLPLLSLRTLLGVGAGQPAGDRQKVIVIRIGDSQVGLVADGARAIIAADLDLVDPVPPVLAARTGGESRIRSVYRGDGGRRLISILTPEQLFKEDVMKRLTGALTNQTGGHAVPDATAGAQQIFLVFRLGDDEFGLPIDSVVEVAQVPTQITRVPRTPKFLEGVVNLRGEVLPVVDQRRRFDMPKLEHAEGRRLVVVQTERHRAGIIVDSVTDVLRSSSDQVEPPPDLTESTSRLVRGVINLESSSRMVLLLDPHELLTRAEQGQLDTFKAKSGKEGV